MRHSFPFELLRIENCHSRTEKNYERHQFFEILWFKNVPEKTFQKIDHQKIKVPKNSIFMIGKGQIHELLDKAEGVSIRIPAEFFLLSDHSNLRIIFNPFINDPILPDATSREHLNDILQLMQKEMTTTNYQPVLYAYLIAFIHKISLSRPDMEISEDRSHRLEILYELVEKHFRSERFASFYAEKVGLSTKRLNQILKTKIGLTLTELLHKIVISEAKKLLAKGDKNINEISFELGFSEQAYFSRFFKKQTGMSPEKFTKKIREN